MHEAKKFWTWTENAHDLKEGCQSVWTVGREACLTQPSTRSFWQRCTRRHASPDPVPPFARLQSRATPVGRSSGVYT